MAALSLWWDQLPAAAPRPALSHDLTVEFAVIGAGFTGLWTAYWLARLEPGLRIAIVEREQVGFGASGRNGGWFSALFPADLDKLARLSSRDDAIAMQLAMEANLLEVEALLAADGIDCDWQRGGTITAIRSDVQAERAAAETSWWQSWGFSDRVMLDQRQAATRFNVSDLQGATFNPHCARVQPLKLARGLAAAVEARGVQIFERTAVTSFDGTSLQTATGAQVRARRVIRATEAYTAQFPGLKRAIAPVYSLMVASPPLTDEQWQQIGLANAETFADYRHLIIYGQRTQDNRIAFGGRGAPYHFGSGISPRFDRHPHTHAAIWQILTELLPQLRELAPTHQWGGPLGIARDWMASVRVDGTSAATAGGYVGDGLGSAALAGRTLAELLTERESERTKLPWVGHRSRDWEPEPWRWLGVNAGLAAMSWADREEALSRRGSVTAKLVNRLIRS